MAAGNEQAVRDMLQRFAKAFTEPRVLLVRVRGDAAAVCAVVLRGEDPGGAA